MVMYGQQAGRLKPSSLQIVEGAPWSVPPKYRFNQVLGNGAYGCVAEFWDTEAERRVAIKRIGNVFNEPLDAKRILRELHCLRHLRDCPYVAQIYDVLAPPSLETWDDVYIVMECVDRDLHQIIRNRYVMEDQHCRYLFYDLLKAFAMIHQAGVVHRDVKPSNILVKFRECRVKVCDFGLSRQLSECCDSRSTTASSSWSSGGSSDESGMMTEYIITRWYRPPEVLLNGGRYDSQVDMWGVGCIMGEVLLGHALFPGCDNVDQLRRIYAVLGKSVEMERMLSGNSVRRLAKDVRKTRLEWERMPYAPAQPMSSLFSSAANPLLVDLISKLIVANPAERWTAQRALTHEYFSKQQAHDLEFFPYGPVPRLLPCSRVTTIKEAYATAPGHRPPAHTPPGIARVQPMDWSFDKVPIIRKSIKLSMFDEIARHYHPHLLDAARSSSPTRQQHSLTSRFSRWSSSCWSSSTSGADGDYHV